MSEFERLIQPGAVAVNGDWMWLFDYNINAMFRMNLLSEKVEYVLSVQGEDAYQRALFTDIFFYGNKVFLVANSAAENVLIDLESMSQRKVHCRRRDMSTKTATPVQHGSKVYMFPKFLGDNIEVWDFEDESVHEIQVDYSKVGQYIELRELMWFGGVMEKEGFWLICGHSAKLVHIDKRGKVDIYPLDTVDKGFCAVSIKGDILYLLPEEGNELVQYDVLCNKSKVILDKINVFPNKCTYSYYRIIVIDEVMILVPGFERQVILINLAFQEKKEWSVKERFCAYAMWKDKLFLFPELGKEWYILNLETQKMERYSCSFPSIRGGIPFYQYWMDDISKLAGIKPDYSELVCGVEQFLDDKGKNLTDDHSKKVHRINGDTIWKNLSSECLK